MSIAQRYNRRFLRAVLTTAVVLSGASCETAQAQFGRFRLPKIQFGSTPPRHTILPVPDAPGSTPPGHSIMPVPDSPSSKPNPIPGFQIPGLGNFIPGGPQNTSPLPPSVAPSPNPDSSKALPAIILPLVLNGPPPFVCPAPPTQPLPAPVLPSPAPSVPDTVEGVETIERQRRPQSGLQQVAEAAKRALREQRYDQALQLANRMNDLAPKNSGVLQFRAAVYIGQMKYPEAAIDVYGALLAGPMWTRVSIKEIYNDPTSYQRDIKWLQAATKDKPDVLAHQFLSAYHAFIQEDWKRSERHLAKMLELKPEEPVASKLLSMVREKRGSDGNATAAISK